MGMKANEVGNWLRRQHARKRDHRDALSDDVVIVRPGPNFHWLMGSLAAAQPKPAAPEPDRAGDDRHEDDNRRQSSP
jgi:hypothetical protein